MYYSARKDKTFHEQSAPPYSCKATSQPQAATTTTTTPNNRSSAPDTARASLSALRGDSAHELDKLRLAMALCFSPVSWRFLEGTRRTGSPTHGTPLLNGKQTQNDGSPFFLFLLIVACLLASIPTREKGPKEPPR
ncbi:unnamed protein product [Ectocarpus sp. 12 AP-2014]